MSKPANNQNIRFPQKWMNGVQCTPRKEWSMVTQSGFSVFYIHNIKYKLIFCHIPFTQVSPEAKYIHGIRSQKGASFPGKLGMSRKGSETLNASMLLSFSGCLPNRGALHCSVTSHWAPWFRLLYLKVYKVCIKPSCLTLWSLPPWPCLQIYVPMGLFLFKSPQKGSRLGLGYARECRTAFYGKSSSEWWSECVCQNRSTQGRCR